jgi:hypothetical protein
MITSFGGYVNWSRQWTPWGDNSRFAVAMQVDNASVG